MTSLLSLTGICRRMAVSAVVRLSIAAVLLAVAGAARADTTDVMREVQQKGSARVIIAMKTGGAGRGRWAMAQPVEQQRAIVAADGATFAQSMDAADIPIMRRYKTLPFAGAVVNSDQLARLASMPEVASVRLVQIQRKLPTSALSGGSVERQQSTSLADSVASIDVPDAWAAGYQGQGLTVAVLDGGFNINHPMLSGKNVGDACFADSFGSTLKAECPSGQSPQIGTGAASTCTLQSDGTNRCDHGSNVASIAVGNDGTNFGVARGANFMPIDVYSADSDHGDCFPDPGYTPCEVTDSIAELDALDYINDNAAKYNVVAVNMSLGGATSSGYCDDNPNKVAIDNLRAKGIAVMIAAGNDGLTGQVDEPGCISTAETIGATNTSTAVASFSDFAAIVDLMAPGVSITGAAGSGNNTITMSGTSMAAPHAAGAWALMRQAFPTATADQIEQALKTTGLAVTRTGSGISVPKIQVMHAVDFLAGHNRLLFNQIVSTAGKSAGLSFLRVYNSSTAAGTITFTMRDATTGTALGTWTSPSIPAGASPQFAISTIEQNATLSPNQTVASAGRNYYNVEAASTFNGYVQYVLWSSGVGVLGNLTSCPAGVSTNGKTLLNVDAGTNLSYVSHIRIINSGSVAGTATLTFVDPVAGTQVAQWTSSSIPAGASLDVTEPTIESAVAALSNATKAGASQYNVSLTNLPGYLQHVIENTQVGVFTDMSAKCDLTATASATGN